MSKRRSVVTGGAGFIGSHLVDKLLELNHSVTVIDNLSNGRRSNLDGALKSPFCQFVEADIAEYDKILPHFKDAEWVFHLAALADIVPSIQRPLDYHRANVDGTAACLEAARSVGVSRFIYAASSSCYGLPDIFPTPETAEIRPMYPYALTKYLGEQLVMHWNKVYGLPTVSLRFFNVYGPRARTSGTYGAVFGVFLSQKLKAAPLTIVGDGTQTRDFTFVSDVVDAVITAAGSELSGEILNVGSGDTYAVNHLAELLGGERVHIEKRPGEPDTTFADISKIRAQLHWNPKVSFTEGVAVMLEHLEDWREAPLWTVDTIAEATKDWHRFLGSEDKVQKQ